VVRSWRDAIESAFAYRENAEDLRSIVSALYAKRAWNFGDILNAELSGLLLAASACSNLFAVAQERLQARLQTDQEQRLIFPFATDAILSAYNALMIFRSPEGHHILGAVSQASIVDTFQLELPRTVDAGDAIRHHHDRAFGRYRGQKRSETRQMISHFGSSLNLTDRDLSEFTYDFSPERVKRLLSAIRDHLYRNQ